MSPFQFLGSSGSNSSDSVRHLMKAFIVVKGCLMMGAVAGILLGERHS